MSIALLGGLILFIGGVQLLLLAVIVYRLIAKHVLDPLGHAVMIERLGVRVTTVEGLVLTTVTKQREAELRLIERFDSWQDTLVKTLGSLESFRSRLDVETQERRREQERTDQIMSALTNMAQRSGRIEKMLEALTHTPEGRALLNPEPEGVIPVARPSIAGSDIALVVGTLAENRLTQGPMVERFEAALAQWLGVRFCVATSSGTAALHLALAAARIGRGHRVLVPDLTYVATANAVRYTGAEVVLADVDPSTWCITEESFDRVRPRPSAVIPVHLYGQGAYIPEGGVVIEDAAQALGSTAEFGRPLGTMGLAGCFSFYGNKVITTGEGGAVVTNDEQLARRLRFLRGQAMSEVRFMHTAVGFNYRLTDFAAALGLGQLARLGQMLVERRRIVATYKERLEGLALIQPGCPNPNAPWLFSCLVPERDGLMERLRQCGVETRPLFVPLHRMPMYSDQGALFPNSSAIADSGISLPTFCGLPIADVHMISDIVASWCLERGEA